ncbi:MAG: RsmB/NOP family class I SAM-dependent RNA methyltransferase [Methanobacteriota archaeon]|nr:MAG: RsmB/NOP family class I SAM-dependent RNA methyltransferase [Euryarchaeota archaeon]
MRSLVQSIGYESAEEILQMHPNDLRPTARVNLHKTSRKDAIEFLLQEGIRAIPIKEVPEGIEIIQGKPKLGHSLSYLQGLVTPQGLGSMLAVHILDPKPGENILDLAAAPGGKTTFIAERMRNQGVVVANDINRARLKAVQANVNRHGLSNVIITNHDGTSIDLGMQFDRILLDAPCTGEGLLVSQPKRRRSKDISDPYILQRLQRQLLAKALSHLKIGGQLVYSTCSLNLVENEEVIDPYLDKLQVEEIHQSIPAPLSSEKIPNAIRLLPSTHGCDGFFIALMRKVE